MAVPAPARRSGREGPALGATLDALAPGGAVKAAKDFKMNLDRTRLATADGLAVLEVRARGQLRHLSALGAAAAAHKGNADAALASAVTLLARVARAGGDPMAQLQAAVAAGPLPPLPPTLPDFKPKAADWCVSPACPHACVTSSRMGSWLRQ
jgi:hypothetical protein